MPLSLDQLKQLFRIDHALVKILTLIESFFPVLMNTMWEMDKKPKVTRGLSHSKA